MNTSPQTTTRTPRLNPFAFPSDTDFRFLLLIVSVLGASLFIYRAVYFSIPSTRDYWFNTINRCWEINPDFPTDLAGFADPQYVAARIAFEECKAPAERANAAWTLGGVFLLLIVAGLIYWTFPLRKIRRDQLVPLSDDAPDVVDYLTKLSRGAKLSSLPTFLWNPLNPTSGGLAFGRLGKYYVSLTGGLVTQFYKDPPAFRAVMLHELAHLRNADVDKTYFAVAVWQAFLIAALLPFLVTLVGNEWAYVISQLWRVLALAALVYLMRNAVLRTRELYADVRASIWDGPEGALSRVLESLPRPKESRRSIAFQLHPDLVTRRQVLEDPGRLFPMRFGDAFATGIAAAIALPDLISLMTALRTGASSPGIESLGGVLVVAPLVVGVVGLGVWRTTFAALARGEGPRNTVYLGVGLGIGILLGLIFSFNSAVRLATTEALSGSELLFYIAWGALLLISLAFFLWWIAAGASAWLEVAVVNKSPRAFYLLGLTTAGGVLAIWLGLLFYIRGLGSAVIYVLVSPLGTLWSIVQHPFTLLLMVSLWAFPLAAWFGRRRVASAPGSGWAFLGSPPQEPVLMRQAPFRLGLALTVGLIVGFVFCGLLLLTRIAVRISLPEAVRNTDDFRLGFFVTQIAVAALMQAGAAALVAAWVQRLGAIHGLFSAFVAGCVMTVGLLVLNIAFGGTLDPPFIWFTFSQVVNEGGLLAIPIAWMVSGLADLVRRIRNSPKLLPQDQIA
jgi:Zn-dependent protease with chaperone function